MACDALSHWLASSVGVVTSFCINPEPVNVEDVRHVLRYVSGTLELGLTLNAEADKPEGVVEYTDSNFAGSRQDRKSTGGLCLHACRSSHHAPVQTSISCRTFHLRGVVACNL